MIVYRVFPHDPAAAAGEPGHPDYLHRPQGRGRADNPDLYEAWYFAHTPSAAIGEVCADIHTWSDDIFLRPFLPAGRVALGQFEIDDDTPILDLDDAQNLLDRGLRPTQVVSRIRPVTRRWAARIFDERNTDGGRRWDGVRWWSYHRPHWTVFVMWVAPQETPRHRFVAAEPLTTTHPEVIDAARSLGRGIV